MTKILKKRKELKKRDSC